MGATIGREVIAKGHAGAHGHSFATTSEIFSAHTRPPLALTASREVAPTCVLV